jgi:NitT/TauT family transport system substrate-binding protein
MNQLRRILIAGALSLATASIIPAPPASAQALEKKDITLGVGGKPLLYYLPLTLAERLGYFKDEGLNVEINDFGGGSKSLQALIGGSVDAVTGAYEHTIRMQEKGQNIQAVVELGRYPGIVVAVRKDKAANFKSMADLKGMNIGVTAPGSSTHILVQYLMVKAGLKPDDASFIGIGSGASAVAAIQKGQIDALSHLDPVITKLVQSGDIKIVVDTRTTEGTLNVFGGENPAAVLYLKTDFINKNPNTVRALVRAFQKSLKWLAKATPEQVADTVPEEYWLGDKNLYITAFKGTRDTYSLDGKIKPEDMAHALDLLVKTDPAFNTKSIDLAKTYDGKFLTQ